MKFSARLRCDAGRDLLKSAVGFFSLCCVEHSTKIVTGVANPEVDFALSVFLFFFAFFFSGF